MSHWCLVIRVILIFDSYHTGLSFKSHPPEVQPLVGRQVLGVLLERMAPPLGAPWSFVLHELQGAHLPGSASIWIPWCL
jgi:hypothetical protein